MNASRTMRIMKEALTAEPARRPHPARSSTPPSTSPTAPSRCPAASSPTSSAPPPPRTSGWPTTTSPRRTPACRRCARRSCGRCANRSGHCSRPASTRLPALPAALAAVNDALTRVPTAALLHWDEKNGPYRAAPHPTTQIVDHALATLAADAADLLTGPDAERLTACGSPPCNRYLLRARPPPLVLHPLRRPRPRRPRLRPPHPARYGLTRTRA